MQHTQRQLRTDASNARLALARVQAAIAAAAVAAAADLKLEPRKAPTPPLMRPAEGAPEGPCGGSNVLRLQLMAPVAALAPPTQPWAP
jgi:hypothetical protein